FRWIKLSITNANDRQAVHPKSENATTACCPILSPRLNPRFAYSGELGTVRLLASAARRSSSRSATNTAAATTMQTAEAPSKERSNTAPIAIDRFTSRPSRLDREGWEMDFDRAIHPRGGYRRG